ncbi:MAG TPA: hypothetical protein VMB79_08190 [Jatrophihabitans sp.]|nr:hypothetical protein [Jatrophihabitans sp.]
MTHPQGVHGSGSAAASDRTTANRPERSRLARYVVLAVVLVGLLESCLLGYHAAKARGVFWSRVQVRFVSPQLDNSNGLQYVAPAMIVVAGAVAKMIDPAPPVRLATAEATLVGEGVRDGFSVQLPNTGGQWANQFISPYLDVQAVGPSPDEVTATTDRLVALIDSDLRTLQDRSGVTAHYRITTSLSPPKPLPIYYQKGSAKRAALATLALGIAITFSCAGLLGRAFAARSGRRRATAARPALA